MIEATAEKIRETNNPRNINITCPMLRLLHFFIKNIKNIEIRTADIYIRTGKNINFKSPSAKNIPNDSNPGSVKSLKIKKIGTTSA